jgi:hypothetical protein
MLFSTPRNCGVGWSVLSDLYICDRLVPSRTDDGNPGSWFWFHRDQFISLAHASLRPIPGLFQVALHRTNMYSVRSILKRGLTDS